MRVSPWLFTRVLLLAFCALPAGCGHRAPATSPPHQAVAETPAALDRLLVLMRERLTLMHEVARWKWQARKPITDPERERELLDRVTAQGQARGLAPEFARSFFSAQIEAGKLVQRADFAHWESGRVTLPVEARDLALVRKDIDSLNDRLIAALAASSGELADPAIQAALPLQAQRILEGPDMNGLIRKTAIAPLWTIRNTER